MQQIQITATIIPSPQRRQAGMSPSQYRIDTNSQYMPDQLRGLITTAINSGVFERDAASVVLLIRPVGVESAA